MTTVDILDMISLILALMVAIIGHEIMHGRVAYHYHDSTAQGLGRLSINPLVHIDLVGTIILPALLYFSHAGFLFGWAKPVPINMRTVVNNGGYNAAIAVSLAGIAYNLLLAIIALIALKFLPQVDGDISFFIHSFFTYLLIYNLVLAFFNLLPIPPLDGSQALGFVFRKFHLHALADKFDAIGQYGMILLIIMIASPLSTYLFAPMHQLIQVALSLI